MRAGDVTRVVYPGLCALALLAAMVPTFTTANAQGAGAQGAPPAQPGAPERLAISRFSPKG